LTEYFFSDKIPSRKNQERRKNMAYQIKEGESQLCHCFQCNEQFMLEKGHEQNYYSSGMCPDCFDEAMKIAFMPDRELQIEKVINCLDKMLIVLNDINNKLK
jgi:hypothetical protein